MLGSLPNNVGKWYYIWTMQNAFPGSYSKGLYIHKIYFHYINTARFWRSCPIIQITSSPQGRWFVTTSSQRILVWNMCTSVGWLIIVRFQGTGRNDDDKIRVRMYAKAVHKTFEWTYDPLKWSRPESLGFDTCGKTSFRLVDRGPVDWFVPS